MELTSGELLYKANGIGSVGRKLYPDITEEFWQFLDSSKPTSNSTDEMLHSGKCISSSVEAYILKLRHRILTVRKAIEHVKHEIMNDIYYENQRLTSVLLQMQKRFDNEALQLVLQYYSIIQREIASSRAKLIQENIEKDLLYKQAAVLRDIRLFACHAMVESRGKIGFSVLPPDSQQFSRCVKAVMDNVQDEGYNDKFRRRIKVLNVFKLQNSFLSGKLQAASERVNNGKIKGLFCCLPQDQFYAFSVFGLYAQVLPFKSPSNLQQLSNELFSTAWFHADPPAGVAGSVRKSTEVAQALQVAGTAAKLAVQRVAAQDEAGAVAARNSRSEHIFRFSRYSTISNLQSIPRSALEGGVFLGLCRVLVVNQLTVETSIEEADIMAGLQRGCDCVYSSTTEEYVLLQPKFVLPEFFMHVQFPAIDVLRNRTKTPAVATKASSITAGGVNSRIPAMLSVTSTGHPDLSPYRNGKQGSSGASSGEAVDPLFPLENQLMGNAIALLDKESNRRGIGSSVVYENQIEAVGFTDAEEDLLNLQDSLLQKQVIVEALHDAVQNFKREKDALLIESARNLVARNVS